MRKLVLAIVAFIAPLGALTAAVKVEFKVETDHADCLYRCGEKAAFTVTVTDSSGKALTAGRFTAKLDNFGERVLAEKEVDLAQGNPFTIAAVKDTPGFMRLALSADTNAFTLPKTPGQNVFSWGVAYEPEKIRPGAENPSDFDSFWANAIRKLDETVPPDLRLEKIDAKSTERHTYSRISFATCDGRRVWGWLNMPVGDGPFPVRVNVPGAGIGALGTEVSDDMITLTMNVHSYSQPDSDAERQAAYKAQDAKYAAPRGVLRYCQAGIHISREDYFYYASILGINRAINWLWSQPQVDRQRFTYSGTSQGGGFGFMLTALNGHFTKSCIFVPAITDLLGSRQEGRQSGWPRIIEAQKPENRAAAEKNAPYFDGVNFAARITCPVRVVVGFADCVCAPAGVYAAYNLIPSRDKEIIHGIGMGHSVYGRFYRQLKEWELTPVLPRDGALMLETTDEGDVHCLGLGVKFVPMQRRADGSFKGHVAKVKADADGALRWTFVPCGTGEQDVVMLKLSVSRWAGGKCVSDAQTVTMPRTHEKGKLIHLTAHESRRFAFSADGETFSLDFGAPVHMHAMDEREWGFDTFVFRFYGKGDAIAATLDAGRTLAVKEREPYVLKRGAKWIPVKVAREIEKGSALDFSGLSHAGPCRRVIANGRHFAFADSPDVPRRFYGVNICESANFARQDVAEAFVRQLRIRGYNALRLHHHDNGMVEGSADGTTINPSQLDRMDRLLAACGREGIYVTTDLFVSRKVPRKAIGLEGDGFMGMDEYKALVLVNEAAFSNLCAFARQWMTHVNPYTGRKWADDPALAFLAFVNEGHIGMDGVETLRKYPEYVAAWKSFCRKETKNISDDIPSGKPWDKTPEMETFARFVAALEMRFANRMRTFLKDELGVKALLTDMSAGMEREPFKAVRMTYYDYVDEHFYWDHPDWVNTAWRLPSKSQNTNPIKRHGADVLAACSRVGLADKPFAASEYNFSGPGEYRHMAGLVAGAEAAREDWGAIWRFDWAGSPWAMAKPEEVRAGYFSMSGDVLAQASDRAALCLFLRGDLAVGDGNAVSADRKNGSFAMNTARTAGGFTEDGKLKAGSLDASCDREPTTIWASTLDGRAFGESRRILVSHLTDLCNDGDTYTDASRKILLSWGKMPHLVRAGKAKIALRLGDGDFRVYALDTAGRRVRTVPHSLNEKRWLCFVADVAADPENAVFLYEIASES